MPVWKLSTKRRPTTRETDGITTHRGVLSSRIYNNTPHVSRIISASINQMRSSRKSRWALSSCCYFFFSLCQLSLMSVTTTGKMPAHNYLVYMKLIRRLDEGRYFRLYSWELTSSRFRGIVSDRLPLHAKTDCINKRNKPARQTKEHGYLMDSGNFFVSKIKTRIASHQGRYKWIFFCFSWDRAKIQTLLMLNQSLDFTPSLSIGLSLFLSRIDCEEFFCFVAL